MCTVTQTADSTMLKQFSLNMMAFCIKTAVQECSTIQSCGAYHICGQRHKTVPVFTFEDRVSVKFVSHEMVEHLCLCPWMRCLLKSLSADSLHLSGRCNIKLHLAVEIFNIPYIFRTENFVRRESAQPCCYACQRGDNFYYEFAQKLSVRTVQKILYEIFQYSESFDVKKANFAVT